MKRLTPLCLLLATLLLAAPLAAEQVHDVGDYRIHYNAFQASFVDPEVARQYDIERSRNRAVLNIAVQKRQPDGRYDPIAAQVRAQAVNRNQQLRRIAMREVREEQAIYYLGQFWIGDEEVLDFEVEVIPADSERSLRVQFRQQFFTD